MNIYDIAIAPGAGRQIDVQADYIYFRTGSAGGGDTTIVFQPISGGEAVYLQPGQAYKMPVAMRGTVVSWIIRNLKGEGTIEGVLLMGEGEFQDNRVSGSVEVIDGARNRTIANQAFITASYCAGVPNNAAQIQLWNPPASGRRLIVQQVTRSSSVGGTVSVAIHDAMLTAFDKNARSKLSGGAQSRAEVRYASKVGATGLPSLSSDVVQAGAAIDRRFIEPVVIMPGYGLTIFHTSLGAEVSGGWEFCEEPI